MIKIESKVIVEFYNIIQRLHDQVMCSATRFVVFQLYFMFVPVPVRVGWGDEDNACTFIVRPRHDIFFQSGRKLVYSVSTLQ